jgi:hypothetical protein
VEFCNKFPLPGLNWKQSPHTPPFVKPAGVLLAHGIPAAGCQLADLENPGRLHDWGFPLALGKFSGLGAVRIDARKPFTVLVKDGDLPVPMLPAFVLAKLRPFSFFQSWDLSDNANISSGSGERKYRFEHRFRRD